MITPTIHLNGDSRATLEAEADNARTALNAAVDAVRAIECNARNYYPQGPQAHAAAVARKIEILRQLETLAEEILNYQIAIQEAGQ